MRTAALHTVRAAIRWWIDLIRRVANLDVEQRRVLMKAIDLLESPAYPHAQASVRETARILGFRDPKMWKSLSHHMKESVDHAENIYRHLEADRRTRTKGTIPLNRPDLNLLVELAYHGFASERG